jgi:hypothetical protein
MATPRPEFASSRLVRKERQKLVRQTVFLILASIIILLGFIFVVIPGFIRIINAVLSDSSSFKPTDALPPQVPIISAPVPATNSAQLSIQGFGEPNSTVIFLLSGNRDQEIQISENGEFKIDTSLSEGENTISAYAVDEAENESAVSKSYLVLLDTESPTLALDDLTDGQTIQGRTNQDLVIKGMTEPKARVMINDRLVFPDAGGAFTHRLRLTEGDNILKFAVTDQGGNKLEQQLTIKFAL